MKIKIALAVTNEDWFAVGGSSYKSEEEAAEAASEELEGYDARFFVVEVEIPDPPKPLILEGIIQTKGSEDAK